MLKKLEKLKKDIDLSLPFSSSLPLLYVVSLCLFLEPFPFQTSGVSFKTFFSSILAWKKMPNYYDFRPE